MKRSSKKIAVLFSGGGYRVESVKWRISNVRCGSQLSYEHNTYLVVTSEKKAYTILQPLPKVSKYHYCTVHTHSLSSQKSKTARRRIQAQNTKSSPTNDQLFLQKQKREQLEQCIFWAPNINIPPQKNITDGSILR